MWSGATAEDPNGDIELDFAVESNCQKAPYDSYEAAKAAAEEAGLVEGTHEFWRFTDQFWKCPPIGYQMGSGRLDTVDSKVLFLGPNSKSILLTDNPNGRDGIWQQAWNDCILDNKFIEWDQADAAGCGPNERENLNYWRVDVILGFSFDETTKAS